MPKKILHLEDDADTRAAVRTILESEGYEILEATEPESCLELIDSERPDLVLLDMMMPQASGWDVFRKIKKKYEGVKIAFLSVMPLSRAQRRVLNQEEDIVDYIEKPFTPGKLLKKIKKALKKVKPIKEKFPLHSLVKGIEAKDDIEILTRLIVNQVILREFSSNFKPTKELQKKIINKLDSLVEGKSLTNFLNKSVKREVNFKKDFELLLKCRLNRRRDCLSVLNTFYEALDPLEKIELVKRKKDGVVNKFCLTSKSKEGENQIAKLIKSILGKKLILKPW